MKLLKYRKNLIIRTATSYYYRIRFYATNVMESTRETGCSFYAHKKRKKNIAYNKKPSEASCYCAYAFERSLSRLYIVNWDNFDCAVKSVIFQGISIRTLHLKNTKQWFTKILAIIPIENEVTVPICYFLKIQYRIQTCCTKFCKTFFITQSKEDRIAANNIEDYAVNFESFPILDVNNISTYCILCNP